MLADSIDIGRIIISYIGGQMELHVFDRNWSKFINPTAFFFGVPKLFVNVIEQQGLRPTLLQQNKPQTSSVCRRFLQLAINAQIPQTLGSDAS